MDLQWIRFACPILTLPKDRLGVYCEGGEKEGKAASRKFGRTEIAKKISVKRSLEAAQFGDRGLTIEQQLHDRHLKNQVLSNLQQEVTAASRRMYAPMMVLETRKKGLVAERSQAIELVKLYKDLEMDPQRNEAWADIVRFSSSLKELNEEIDVARVVQHNQSISLTAKQNDLERILNGSTPSATTLATVLIPPLATPARPPVTLTPMSSPINSITIL